MDAARRPFLDFRDPWGNRIEIVGYDNIQFTKAPNVLRGMGLEHSGQERERQEGAGRERHGAKLAPISDRSRSASEFPDAGAVQRLCGSDYLGARLISSTSCLPATSARCNRRIFLEGANPASDANSGPR